MRLKYIPVLISIVLGIIGSAANYSITLNNQQRFIENELIYAAEKRFLMINEIINHSVTVLHSLALHFSVSESVTRKEFEEFTGPLFHHHPYFQAVEWIPKILDKERHVYEQSVRDEGFSGFQITQKERDKLIRRQQQQEYFPVDFIYPFKGNEKAFGFDLASNPIRRAALEKVRDQKIMMLATARIILVQESGTQYGFLLFFPVFKKGKLHKTTEDRQKNLRGFVLGVFRIGDLLCSAHFGDTDIDVFDLLAEEQPQLLFSDGRSNGTEMAYEKELDVGGRKWKIIFRLTSGVMEQNKDYSAEIELIVGLLFTLLLSAVIFILLTKNLAIKKEVIIRTKQSVASELYIKAIFNTTVDGIITINNEGNIQTMNPAAEKMFGFRLEEIVGKNVKILMPEPYKSSHDAYIKAYLTSGAPKIIGIGREVTACRKDGSQFPMRLSVGEMNVENSQMFVGMTIDITELKETEKSLREAKEQAETANRLKSEFLNTISHELRTPLTIILGNIEELTDENELPENDEVADIAQDIENAGLHLLTLINDLLDLSKIEAGKMKLMLKPVVLNEYISDVLDTVKRLAKEKMLRLIFQPEFDAKVNGDPIRLKQVLLNLLNNAIKFTDEGSITIKTEIKAEKAVIRVADTGCGIHREDLQYVFESFRQVDGSDTRAAKGSGLGLAITKKLVELHGGTITVESEVGKGSCFTYSIPIYSKEENHES